MALTAADVLKTIQNWGVDVASAYLGINGIMEALSVRQDRVHFVQVRHEEAAAFMACACPRRRPSTRPRFANALARRAEPPAHRADCAIAQSVG
jgi:hypothetical protein